MSNNNLYLYLPIPERTRAAFGDKTYSELWLTHQSSVTGQIEAISDEYERGVVIIDLDNYKSREI
jgi:hypothetical protein|tara:strand:+ start:30 stop:224 length:195 start_codon:yes stop_codon:yes gene_type:complete